MMITASAVFIDGFFICFTPFHRTLDSQSSSVSSFAINFRSICSR
jgi:hypothetical protein